MTDRRPERGASGTVDSIGFFPPVPAPNWRRTIMYCPECGKPVDPGANFCPGYGKARGGGCSPPTATGNPLAIWGFVCSLLGLVLPLKYADIIISAAGAAVSIVAVNRPGLRGLAIAGIVIGLAGAVGAAFILLTEPEFYTDLWKD